MSRRAQRRKSSKSSGAGKKNVASWLYRTLGILVLAAILAGFGGYFWVQSYLRSDDFRVFLGEKVGEVMNADAHFELFEWQGMQASTDGFSAENGKLIQSMRADSIEAKLNLSGIKRGVWEISDLQIQQLDVLIDTRSQGGNSNDKLEAKEELSDQGGLLVGMLPKRAELSSAEIDWLNLDLQTSDGSLEASNVIARIDAANKDGVYDVNLSEGLIETTWFGSALDLISARGKYQNGRIFLTDLQAEVYERGLLNLSGEVDKDQFGFYGNLRDIRVEELVSGDWQQRLTGDLVTEFKVSSGVQRADGTKLNTTLRGAVELKRGTLTSLPLLDTIAAYANTRRFRRLDFSEAKLKYKKQGGRLELTDIILASEGLVRIEGNLTLENDVLDGRFNVGITPGTLSHIPGAETKVFTRGEKGLLWAPLRITGTVGSPKEDLTDRLITAAGERMFELVPETGKMVLKFAQANAAELPGKAVEAGKDVLKTGVDVLNTGLEEGVVEGVEESVRGLFDLIPSAPPSPKEEPKTE